MQTISTAIAALALLAFTPNLVAQQEYFKLLPSTGVGAERFGNSVAICGDRCAVGTWWSGPASIYIFDATTGQQLYKLRPGDTVAGENFGYSVCIDGNRVVAGAPGDEDNGVNSGSAYVFDVATGQELLKLLPADGAMGDRFGWSVSISGDRCVVSAIDDDDNGSGSGSAYVFDVTTGQELHKLLPTDGAPGDTLGFSVCIDGNLVVIGAFEDDDNGINSGSAYIYDATTGQQLHKLLPTDGATGDEFGYSVAMDGNCVVIGASEDNDNGVDSGSAYIFDATTGQQLLKLVPADGAAFDSFGCAVSARGNLAVIGASHVYDNGTRSGAAYVFDVATHRQLFKLSASDHANDDWFGSSVCINDSRIVVGAFLDDDFGSRSGSAYLFDLTEPGTGYCFGDPGSGTPCPCNNDNDGGIAGSGCGNGVFASGAHLVGYGVASVTNDSLELISVNLEPNNSGLYLQADNDLSPGVVWGDGLKCCGGNLKRLGVRIADAYGFSATTDLALTISAKAGNISPGDTKFYQCWYRNPTASPCGFDFNASNGYAITWLP